MATKCGGNVACLLGVNNALAGFDAGADWRGREGDRLYLASADPGRLIGDAVIET